MIKYGVSPNESVIAIKKELHNTIRSMVGSYSVPFTSSYSSLVNTIMLRARREQAYAVFVPYERSKLI